MAGPACAQQSMRAERPAKKKLNQATDIVLLPVASISGRQNVHQLS